MYVPSVRHRKNRTRHTPAEGNPGNSDCDFITLIDGRIMFIYSKSKSADFYDPENADPEAAFTRDDGELWSFNRTDMGRQYEMFSFDRDETWTSPQLSRSTSPCSPMSMKMIPGSGNLLAVWDPVPYYNGIVQFSEWKDTFGTGNKQR